MNRAKIHINRGSKTTIGSEIQIQNGTQYRKHERYRCRQDCQGLPGIGQDQLWLPGIGWDRLGSGLLHQKKYCLGTWQPCSPDLWSVPRTVCIHCSKTILEVQQKCGLGITLKSTQEGKLNNSISRMCLPVCKQLYPEYFLSREESPWETLLMTYIVQIPKDIFGWKELSPDTIPVISCTKPLAHSGTQNMLIKSVTNCWDSRDIGSLRYPPLQALGHIHGAIDIKIGSMGN